MTDWTDLPWRTMRGSASVVAAASAIELIDLVLENLPHEAWHEGDPSGSPLSCWTADGEDEDDLSICVDLIVEAPAGGLSHMSLLIEHGSTSRDVAVVCDPSLVEHLLEQPSELMRFVSGLLCDAITTEDVVPAARPPRMDHAGLDAEGAAMLVSEAVRRGMDPTKPIRMETWGPCPLSPSIVRTTGSDLQAVETMHDDVLSAVRLTVNPAGAVLLAPLISTVDGDGFDAMELLQIHRAIARSMAA